MLYNSALHHETPHHLISHRIAYRASSERSLTSRGQPRIDHQARTPKPSNSSSLWPTCCENSCHRLYAFEKYWSSRREPESILNGRDILVSHSSASAADRGRIKSERQGRSSDSQPPEKSSRHSKSFRAVGTWSTVSLNDAKQKGKVIRDHDDIDGEPIQVCGARASSTQVGSPHCFAAHILLRISDYFLSFFSNS